MRETDRERSELGGGECYQGESALSCYRNAGGEMAGVTAAIFHSLNQRHLSVCEAEEWSGIVQRRQKWRQSSCCAWQSWNPHEVYLFFYSRAEGEGREKKREQSQAELSKGGSEPSFLPSCCRCAAGMRSAGCMTISSSWSNFTSHGIISYSS